MFDFILYFIYMSIVGIFELVWKYINVFVFIGFLFYLYLAISGRESELMEKRKKTIVIALIVYFPILLSPLVSYAHYSAICSMNGGIKTYDSIEISSEYFENNRNIVSVQGFHKFDDKRMIVGEKGYRFDGGISVVNFGVRKHDFKIYSESTSELLSEGVSFSFRSDSFPLYLSPINWFSSDKCWKSDYLNSGRLLDNMLYVLFVNKGN